jgi:hypothetical protein
MKSGVYFYFWFVWNITEIFLGSEMKLISHKINCFKVNSSMAFSVFTMLCNHYPFKQLFPFPSVPESLATSSLEFCHYGCTYSGYFLQIESCSVYFFFFFKLRVSCSKKQELYHLSHTCNTLVILEMGTCVLFNRLTSNSYSPDLSIPSS